MNFLVFPQTKRERFTRPISADYPYARMAPVLIYSGPFAGSSAINANILNCSPEWRTVSDELQKLFEAESVSIQDLNPKDLINPKPRR